MIKERLDPSENEIVQITDEHLHVGMKIIRMNSIRKNILESRL